MIQYAHQLDTSLPEKCPVPQTHAPDKAAEDVLGAATTGNQHLPQEPNDERMHIDGEEEETTMGEGVVAVEGETTREGEELPVVVQQPEVQTTAIAMAQRPSQAPQPLSSDAPSLTRPRFDVERLKQIVAEMDLRRKEWLRQYKTNLDLNDVLEIRNPQSVIEFVPEILVNMKKEELNHMYPSNFLDRSLQMEISDKYR